MGLREDDCLRGFLGFNTIFVAAIYLYFTVGCRTVEVSQLKMTNQNPETATNVADRIVFKFPF